MTSEISILKLAGEIGFALWIFGYLAKDALKILGAVSADGIRQFKALKKELCDLDQPHEMEPQQKSKDADDG